MAEIIGDMERRLARLETRVLGGADYKSSPNTCPNCGASRRLAELHKAQYGCGHVLSLNSDGAWVTVWPCPVEVPK